MTQICDGRVSNNLNAEFIFILELAFVSNVIEIMPCFPVP
jgi:hypothetical protein